MRAAPPGPQRQSDLFLLERTFAKGATVRIPETETFDREKLDTKGLVRNSLDEDS